MLDYFTNFKVVNKFNLLFRRRVQAILIHTQFHSKNIGRTCLYTLWTNVQWMPIHPPAKAGGILG